MLTFWALAYQYQEDVFYDFAKKDDVLELKTTCLLPTEEMAKQIINDEMGDDYVPVPVYIAKYSDGVLSYDVGPVERWEHE